MLGEQISTVEPIHINCSVQFVPHASNEKDHPEMVVE